MLITFEGIDGCGKSTQIEKLSQFLTEKGHDVHIFREPGGTPLSEQIRDILLNSSEDIDPVAETLLFSAARAQLVARRIRPLLKTGSIVILDRFYDSTTAYQGYGRQAIPVDQIENLNTLATQELEPDLTIYLSLDPEKAARRRTSGEVEDRMERSGHDFFQKVSEGYDRIASRNKRVVTLDSSQSPEQTFAKIISRLKQRLPHLFK